jgi:hypothetical protein
MAQIQNKHEFIKELEKFTKTGHGVNIAYEFLDKKIIIEEKEESGRGHIVLDISSYDEDKYLFVKIEHWSNHTIGSSDKHNDGIVLKVNLLEKNIDVFLFELKIQLRYNNLQKASAQLANAYRFIKYLQLEECFEVQYKFYIAYKENSIDRDADKLKTLTRFSLKLFKSVYENQNTIPLQIPFCRYREFNFQQLTFGQTIII